LRGKGREVIGGNEGYQLRDETSAYKALLGAEKYDMGLENTYFWGINID
jgi:hypothetical protein